MDVAMVTSCNTNKNMAVYEVFSHSVCYKYKSTLCSKSTCFLVLTTFLTIFLSLLVAYRSHGFWMKSASYREQPRVRFKHHYILLMETSRSDAPILCTTIPSLNEMTEEFNHCTMVKSREEDNNRDGNYDELLLEMEIAVPENAAVHFVQLILIFDYILQKQCLLEMETFGVIAQSTALPGARLQLTGDLELVQKELLKSRGKDVRFNYSAFEQSRMEPEQFQIEKVLREYAKRNVSTNVGNLYVVWSRGELLDEPFQLSVNIAYPEETIHYQPGFWQVMKWAWIQYLAVLVIFHCLFHCVKNYVFINRLVPTIKEIPWKKTF